MAGISPEATLKLQEILHPMMATQPTKLGYPSEKSQSNFYPGEERITEEETETITDMVEDRGIGSENTRLQKQPRRDTEDFDTFHVLQASAEKDPEPRLIGEIAIGDNAQRKSSSAAVTIPRRWIRSAWSFSKHGN